jgi:pimeloyl-ACP methyl ester carboxylesterase
VTTVIFHHGTPASARLYEAWVEDARSRGIDLVGCLRAGYHGKPRNEGRDIAAVAEDVSRFADERGIGEFATWGISGGGPHALACAALLPDRVTAAACIGTPAPYGAEGLDWYAGQGEGNVVEFETALQGEEPLRSLLEREAAALLGGEESGLDTLMSPPDLAILPRLMGFLGQTFNEAISSSVEGWVDDDLAFVRDWGFDVGDIRVPVLLVHGVQDRFVPVEHGRWLAQRIPGVETRILDDEGHLSLYGRIPEVHEWLLAR